jgi:hypothetical protein
VTSSLERRPRRPNQSERSADPCPCRPPCTTSPTTPYFPRRT